MTAALRLQPEPVLRAAPSREDRVRADGRDPIALSTLQPGLSYFDAAEGFVAYGRALGVSLSLGGPVCPAEDELQLARRFLEQPGAALFYVDDALAFGAGGGACRASLGCDRVLDLRAADTFAAAPVKSAVRKAAKGGFALGELHLEDGRPEDRAFLARVNAAALERSVVPYEMRFLNRPMTLEASPARVFALEQRGERFGYAVLDPYFERGQVKGYLLNLLRFGPTSLWGVYLAAVQALAGRLLAEGVTELSLGFCPLARLDVDGSSAPMRPQLRWLARRYAGIDYFARLEGMKGQLGGTWKRRWLLTRSPQLVTPMLAFLELTGVPLGQLVKDQLAEAWAKWRSPRAA